MNNVKEIDIKNRNYFFLDNMINIKMFEPNKIAIGEKSYKNIFFFSILDIWQRILYLIIDKINGCNEENSGKKHLTLAPTDTLKKFKELWSKIRVFFISITNCLHNSKLNNLDDCEEKYMKNKSNSDENLPLKKTLELYDMIIVVRSVFHESNKNYPQAFLDKYMFKLSASRAN